MSEPVMTLDLSGLPTEPPPPPMGVVDRPKLFKALRINRDGVVRLARFLGVRVCGCHQHGIELVDAIMKAST